MSLQAVIFDFDGVITDTEPLHYRAFIELLGPFGMVFSWEDYLERFIGFDDRDALRLAFSEAGRELEPADLEQMMNTKAAWFKQAAAQADLEPFPGVLDLLEELREEPIGLCTGALASDVDPVLERFDLSDRFAARVTAEQVEHSKPDPESYRRCFEALRAAFPERDLEPHRCVAIEDTPTGLQSARGAGLRTLAVCTTHEAGVLGDADRIMDSLIGVSRGILSELCG